MKPTDSDNGGEMKLPFRPRARLLQLLGDQLIGTRRLGPRHIACVSNC